MKTLVIHPQDPTTSFLSQIYAPLNNKTVIDGGFTKSELRSLIEHHDRVLMFGHGSPFGLLNPDQFPDAGFYIVDDSMAVELKEKSSNLYIWCHADQFVRRHGLSGLNCAMFISEVVESFIYGFEDVDRVTIERSNEIFVHIVTKYINEPLGLLYEKLIYEYGLLARNNPIAKFNLERLYCTCSGTGQNINKVAV